MQILKCDNCNEQIIKSASVIVIPMYQNKEYDLCNNCWALFVRTFSGLFPGIKKQLKDKENK